MAIHHQAKPIPNVATAIDDDLDFEFTPMPGNTLTPPAAVFSPEAAAVPVIVAAPVAESTSNAPDEPDSKPAEPGEQEDLQDPTMEESETAAHREEVSVSAKVGRPTGRNKGGDGKAAKKADAKRPCYRTSLYLPYELADDVDTYRRKLRRHFSAVENSLSNVFIRAMEDKLYRSYRCNQCDLIFSVASEGSIAITPTTCPVCGGNVKLHRFTR